LNDFRHEENFGRYDIDIKKTIPDFSKK